jgi:myo-inositol-1(or 4)-monophosphatase
MRCDGNGTALRPSAATHLVDVSLDAAYPNGDRFQAVRMLADPAFMTAFRPRVLSTTLALAWVAVGRRAAAGGLIAGADEETHAALIAIIGEQFTM